MAHRSILTERQRSALFDLPIDELSLLRHYTLADDDLDHINARRRAENRIGFALQLCALRYPGRLLSSHEVIPEQAIRFIGAQLGLTGDEILPYAARRDRRTSDSHKWREDRQDAYGGSQRFQHSRIGRQGSRQAVKL